MSTTQPTTPTTDSTEPKHKPGCHWECNKCGDIYITPRPAKQVLCATCNQRLGVNRAWMKPT